jgi:hypothetical protein
LRRLNIRTPDEDFSLLLAAAEDYDKRCSFEEDGLHPKLLVVVTGRGPMKDEYCR